MLDALESFQGKQVIIIGDIMLDQYLVGKVDRVSPEAPVPVVNVQSKEARLGGAGNVINNILSLGAIPIPCSIIGNDVEGEQVLHILKKKGITTKGILSFNDRHTTTKTRVLSKNQQIVRFDQETIEYLAKTAEEQFLKNTLSLLENNAIDVVILQDYNKGVLTKNIISKILFYCKQNNIPTAVDPKAKNFFAYKDVTLFKPNLKEISEALQIEVDATSLRSLNAINKLLREKINHKIALITLSEYGVYIKNESEDGIISPTKIRNIADVSGAGDTVIALAALALTVSLNISQIAELSNIVGGLVCEMVGVVPISIDKLTSELKQIQSIEAN